MKNLFLSLSILLSGVAVSQVNVYECGVTSPYVSPSDVLNGAYGFYRPCIEFGANYNFQFSGDVNKDIKASEYIHIKEGFHAGLFNLGKGVQLRITEKSLFDVAVMNYPDLNHIEKYKKVEFGVDLEGEIEDRIKEFLEPGTFSGLDPLNPFIADDMDPNTSELVMHATFIHPSTWTVKERDFFYYHEYEQVGPGYGVDHPNYGTGDLGWSDAINDNNDYLMRVRFAPPRAGEWEAHFSITYDGSTMQLPVFTFLVDDNNHPGFVKVHYNQRNLQREDGIVFPLGHVFPGPYNRVDGGQVPWGDPGKEENKTEYNTTVADWNQYLGDIESYINQGGKSFKMVQTSYGNLIEFEELGNYRKRLQYAWEQDKILDLCEENDVLVNFNLLFQDVIFGYGQNGNPKQGGGYWGDPWDYGNYNPDHTINTNDYYPSYCYFVPGTLPSNQFLDPKMMNYHKQRTRYYVARYGYSPQIYTWELMSEPFHMDAFIDGKIINPATGGEIDDGPAENVDHPGHQVAINAINTYHNTLSDYIKDELEDKDHLITLQQAIVPENSDIYPYQCTFNENIDIVGYNYYSEKPEKLVEFKDGKDGKSNLDIIEVFPDEREISMYTTLYRQFTLFRKPMILSEAGHGSAGDVNIQCFKSIGNNIDVMTNGFIGVAGMHPWEGYQYNYNNQYDERQLWPATIAAEKHMNSDNVLTTLNHWDGMWKQGRQVAFVKEKINGQILEKDKVKELQYYLSQSNEFATGYVRNRSYNVFTASNCPITIALDYPFNTYYVFQYDDGPDKNHLYVKGLQKDVYYLTTWFDYLTGQQLSPSQFQQADNKNRIKLIYPTLTILNPLRPILWFTTQKVNLRPEEAEQLIVNDRVEIEEEDLIFGAYPNPFNEEIVVTSQQDDHLEIYSVTGKLVAMIRTTEREIKVSTTHLEKGVYFIKSTLNNKTIKLVKQ